MSFFHQWNKKIAYLVGAKEESLKTARSRLLILNGICLALFAIIVIRVGDLTLIQTPREPLSDKIASQTYHERSDIVDRNGVLLATTLQVASLYADPTMIDNKAFVAKQLETILDIENPLSKLERKNRFVWIKRGITPKEHYEINALGQPGLGFRMESRRFYPQGNLSAHVVGFTNVDGKGLEGIERQYDKELSAGEDALELGLDIRIQHALHKALREKMNEFSAKAAIGGVIDVETGEIVAAVSLPDFDPHHAGKAQKNQKFNRFAVGVYEMGSTFKLFSTANFLEETQKPFSHTFDAREPLKEGRFTINDFHAEKRILTVPEVFIHSSNIGSALMGRAAGTQSMKDFYADLGLLDRIETDFPALGKPLIPSPWRDINTLTGAYGHGIAVTPLHVLQATAAIVNGGIVPDLKFAKTDRKNNEIQKRILSAATAHKMRQLLRLNVTDGSGEKADVKGYVVGGKTGTSEKVTATGYDEDKLLSSFIGVFPTHAPRYAVLAILDEPQGTKASFGYATGGWTGAPVVGDVIADMARIMGIPPVAQEPNLTAGLERYLSQETDVTKASY
jgi:cell division protein FtsI (penicillin-binding protein 3)